MLLLSDSVLRPSAGFWLLEKEHMEEEHAEGKEQFPFA